MPKSYRPIDHSRVTTYPVKSRYSKVSAAEAGQVWTKGGRLTTFVESLPRILAGRDFRALVEGILTARRRSKPIIWGIGGHVLKVGLAPLLIDLMEKGCLTALATNGACAVHDFELALVGSTSEDVEAALTAGEFGMAEETGRIINEAVTEGGKKDWGFGKALGEKIRSLNPPYLASSVFAAAARLDLPATIHVAIGTDIPHMHPSCDAAALGEATYHDFRLLTAVVAEMGEGGVYLNVGSAVLLPEVFLKALQLARNLGHDVKNFTTANLDFLQHYRPRENVLIRPTQKGGQGYALTGHHEIMIPLLAAALIEGL